MKKLIILVVLVAFACSMFMACAATEKCKTDVDDCKEACDKAAKLSDAFDKSSCTKGCDNEEDDCMEAAGCSGS